MSRIDNDEYPTPRWMTECLYDHAHIKGTIFEPTSGKDDAIAGFLREKGHKVITNDLYYDTKTYQFDATYEEGWENTKYGESFDWIVANPPFSCYMSILMNAYIHTKIGVAFLLRVSADEMTMTQSEKYNWWATHPESLVIKMPRYCFAKSSKSGNFSTDSAYCQWFVWRKDGLKYPQQVIRLPHDRISGFTRKPTDRQVNRQPLTQLE